MAHHHVVLINISAAAFSDDPSDQAWAALGAAMYEVAAATSEDNDGYLTAAEIASEAAYDHFNTLSPSNSPWL